MITRKTAKAYAVLAIVLDRISEEQQSQLLIEPYLNGRENGFSLHRLFTGEKMVAFSENRNSDSIVLYTGDRTDFSMQGNVGNDATWKRRRMFGCYNYVKAAVAIISFLFPET